MKQLLVPTPHLLYAFQRLLHVLKRRHIEDALAEKIIDGVDFSKNNAYLEDYAKNNLNMGKVEPTQIEYIKLSSEDKAEIKKDTSKRGILDMIKNVI